MKVLLLQVGKTANRNFTSAITDYYQRISHYVPFEIQTIAELKGTKSLSESQQKEREGEMIPARSSHQTPLSCLMSVARNTVLLSSPHG